MASSDDSTLMKVAIFGITVSLFCTLGVSLMLVETGDYDYDDITAYRNDLIEFSGESMINDNPWILTHVYTPWSSGDSDDQVDSDGWLYGTDVTSYTGIGSSAYIALDKNHKTTIPLTYETEATSYDEVSGDQWWANIPIIGDLGKAVGFDPYTYETKTANNWAFTGYRYVFDPTLPFADTETASTKDGSLNIFWYNYDGSEGLSGGLQVYGGDILLASYSASDIIADYNDSSGYATTYNFDFNGITLHLSIRFNPSVINHGASFMEAWSNGDWTMAISSVSAGNFLDVENSASYANGVGNMLETFIQIFTFNVPDLDNEWASMILWLLCGLPMTIAMLCVAMRVIQVVKPSWL